MISIAPDNMEGDGMFRERSMALEPSWKLHKHSSSVTIKIMPEADAISRIAPQGLLEREGKEICNATIPWSWFLIV